MHSSPNRLAVSVTQLGSPKGRPRWTQQRNAATSASVCGWLTSCSQAVGERTGPPTLWYLGNVDGPRCHANQVVPATGLVDDAITTARKKSIVDQAGKPDLLPCRGNGFPAIRRRLTHGRVRYISRRMVHCGQLFPQFLRGPLEELPEGQVGQLRFRPGGGFEEVP